jgi:hypothetical protein
MRSVPAGEELYEILLGLGDSHDSERAHDRSAAIVGAAFIEYGLKQAISHHLAKDTEDPEHDYLFEADEAPLRDFAARAKLARALGILTQSEYDDIACLRLIRNAFAHTKTRIDFSTQVVADYCSDLQNVWENELFKGTTFLGTKDSALFKALGGNRRVFALSVCMHYWKLTIYPGLNFLREPSLAAYAASVIDK